MTLEQTAYLFDVKASFTEFVSDLAYKNRAGIGKNRPYLNVQLVYLEAFINIVTQYFSSPDPSVDENFCTADEIEIVMNRINNIMGTSHWIDVA